MADCLGAIATGLDCGHGACLSFDDNSSRWVEVDSGFGMESPSTSRNGSNPVWSCQCDPGYFTAEEIGFGHVWTEQHGMPCVVWLRWFSTLDTITLVCSIIGLFMHVMIMGSKLRRKGRQGGRIRTLLRLVPGGAIWGTFIIYSVASLSLFGEGLHHFPGTDPLVTFVLALVAFATNAGWALQIQKYTTYLAIRDMTFGQKKFARTLSLVRKCGVLSTIMIIAADIPLIYAPFTEGSAQRWCLWLSVLFASISDVCITFDVSIIFYVIRDLGSLEKEFPKERSPSLSFKDQSRGTLVRSKGGDQDPARRIRAARQGLKYAVYPLYIQFLLTILFGIWALVDPNGFEKYPYWNSFRFAFATLGGLFFPMSYFQRERVRKSVRSSVVMPGHGADLRVHVSTAQSTKTMDVVSSSMTTK